MPRPVPGGQPTRRQIIQALRRRGNRAKEQAQAAVAGLTGQLADLAEQATAEAGPVLRNGRRAVTELATTLARAAAVTTQTRTRLAGGTPTAATRIVSLHDPTPDPSSKDG